MRKKTAIIILIAVNILWSNQSYSTDTIPSFEQMYSFEDIQLIEYEFLVIGLSPLSSDPPDTSMWGRKQFTILSRDVSQDSAIVDFELRKFSFLDNSIVDTIGRFRIYNNEFNGYPELSNVCERGISHLACESNLTEWFEITSCLLDNGSNVDNQQKFGRLTKSGDGGLAFNAGVIQGIGYEHFELSGAQNLFIDEKMVGFISSNDTIGEISDLDEFSSTENLEEVLSEAVLSPNPTSGRLVISPYDRQMRVTIIDITGNVHGGPVDYHGVMDVSDLSPGLYCVQIHRRGIEVTIRHFVKI